MASVVASFISFELKFIRNNVGPYTRRLGKGRLQVQNVSDSFVHLDKCSKAVPFCCSTLGACARHMPARNRNQTCTGHLGKHLIQGGPQTNASHVHFFWGQAKHVLPSDTTTPNTPPHNIALLCIGHLGKHLLQASNAICRSCRCGRHRILGGTFSHNKILVCTRFVDNKELYLQRSSSTHQSKAFQLCPPIASIVLANVPFHSCRTF